MATSLHMPTHATGVFTISGRTILQDSAPFQVRGVCYQPAQIGEDPSAAPTYGDYYTATYQARYMRDFWNLRLMGANVVRIYGWTIGANHTDFLNQAYNGGNQSLYLLINRYINPSTDWSNASAVNALVADWSAIANELKNAPAVMGFLIGNEVNAQNANGYNTNFWNAMNQIAGAVKSTAPDKLVSVAITDALDQVDLFDASMSQLDFWGIQVYRGSTFGAFFGDYAARSDKPMIITEFGYDAYDAVAGTEFAGDALLPANAMEGLWNELRLNAAVAAGACVFEYADEWWKAGSPGTHDSPMGWPGPFADGEGNEEWWGVFRVVDNGSNLDILQPRAMFYRLAAMWNPPYATTLQPLSGAGNPQARFNYPAHLRDQHLQVEMSAGLNEWTSVADNSVSTYLSATTPAVSIQNAVVGGDVIVTWTRLPSATVPVNLLMNSDFEAGDVSGWLGTGVASTSAAKAGAHSLRLQGGGSFSVPVAFQTLPAAPGDEFNLSGYMMTTAALPADATFGLFKIVFQDSVGNDLEPAAVSTGQFGPGDNPGGESQPFLNSGSAVYTWVFSEVQAVAPPSTASVLFFALNVDQSPATMYFDSIQAIDVAAPPAALPSLESQGSVRVRNAGR